MEINPLGRSDADEAFLIEKSHFTNPFGLDDLIEYSRNGFSFAARDSGRVIGYILGEKVLDECQIMKVAVSKEHLRKGIGRALVRALIDLCTRSGVKKMFLEVRASNSPAADLYEKLGFSRVSVRKGYYRDPTEDAVVMQRIL